VMSFLMRQSRNFMIRVILVLLASYAVAGVFLLGNTDVHASVKVIGKKAAVKVIGNKKVTSDIIKGRVRVSLDEEDWTAEVDDSIKKLYRTGLFANVGIVRAHDKLIVRVVENPQVNSVVFKGNQLLDDEMLSSLVDLKPGDFLSDTMLRTKVRNLLEVYRRHGQYGATVTIGKKSIPGGFVDIVFKIKEGPQSVIARIDFVGNRVFSSSKLKKIIVSRETGALGFLRLTDTYNPSVLEYDKGLLTKFYARNGYPDFQVTTTSGALDRSTGRAFVTFSLSEGDYYTLGKVGLQTSISSDKKSLRKLITTKTGDPYNADKIQETVKALTAEAVRRGKVFASVRVRSIRDYSKKTIALTYYLEKGNRVYVNKINVLGNTFTRDYVIRSAFDIVEGDPYNPGQVDAAVLRLKRMGWLADINVSPKLSERPGFVDLLVQVKEKEKYGQLSAGISYDMSAGLGAQGGIFHTNVFGLGQTARLNATKATATSKLSASFADPSMLGSGIPVQVVLDRSLSSSTRPKYSDTGHSFAVKFNLPLVSNWFLKTGWSLSRRVINVDSDDDDDSTETTTTTTVLEDVSKVTVLGDGSMVTKTTDEDKISGLSYMFRRLIKEGPRTSSGPFVGIIWNSTNHALFPTAGSYAGLEFAVAGLGGDAVYLKTTANLRYYYELSERLNLIAEFHGRAGHVIGGSGGVHPVDNFVLSDDVIRGFVSKGIGPVNTSKGADALGGTAYWAASAGLRAPVPGVPEEVDVYFTAFVDTGHLFGVDPAVMKALNEKVMHRNTVRASYGVGLVFSTPFGIMKAYYAVPLLKDRADLTKSFNFNIGGSFF